MASPVWTGTISFGLVSVPVKAYTAARDHAVHFRQIDRASGSRVQHKNVAQATGEEVDSGNIILGYEVADGSYVTFERDELDEIRPSSTKAIRVEDFVSLDDVDPIYYQRTYWLGPDGEAAKEPYALLLAAMQDRGRVAIGSVVMRTKQYLAAVRPLDGALAMSTMRFADEIVDRSSLGEIAIPEQEPDPKLLDLAVQIVDAMAGSWEPERYHDTYTEEVRNLIDAKAKGQTITVAEAEGPATKVLDLVEALRASVDEVGARRGSSGEPEAKRPRAKKSA